MPKVLRGPLGLKDQLAQLAPLVLSGLLGQLVLLALQAPPA